MMKFSFSILQYRHDTWSGEALNVGVLLACPEHRFLEFSGETRISRRLTAAYPDLHRGDLGAALRDIPASVRKLGRSLYAPLFSRSKPETAAEIAEMIFPNSDAAFGWGRGGSGITADPSAELDRLVARYVTRFDPPRAEQLRSDEDVFRGVGGILKDCGVADRFEARTVRSDLVSVPFPHTFQNGLLHAVKPLSFDLHDDEQVEKKAATWTGYLVNLRKPRFPFRPYLLLGRPSIAARQDAFDRAHKMLSIASDDVGLGGDVLIEDNGPALADKLVRLAGGDARPPVH